jgi:D-xylulose reductase
MGHEASGIIDSIGPAVTRVQPGDRVAIEPGFPCRRCKLCKSGRYNLCAKMVFPAHPPRAPGTLVRLFRIPEDFVHRIPEHVSLEEAVMAEPLSVAVHAIRLAQLRPGHQVLVQGSGTIGLLVAATAKCFGVKSIVVTDINPEKLKLAQELVGCKTFLPNSSSRPEEIAEGLKEDNGLPDGFDMVFECTGVESSAQVGLHALEAGGQYIQIGMGKPYQTLPLLAMCEKEIVLKTCFRYGAGDYETAVQLLCSGSVAVKSMISSTVPFERAEEAWERTRRGEGLKNLIQGVLD